MAQGFGFFIKPAAVHTGAVVDNIGVDHGNTRLSGVAKHPNGCSKCLIHVSIEIAGLVEVGGNKINQNQCRSLTEADFVSVNLGVVSVCAVAHAGFARKKLKGLICLMI